MNREPPQPGVGGEESSDGRDEDMVDEGVPARHSQRARQNPLVGTKVALAVQAPVTSSAMNGQEVAKVVPFQP